MFNQAHLSPRIDRGNTYTHSTAFLFNGEVSLSSLTNQERLHDLRVAGNPYSCRTHLPRVFVISQPDKLRMPKVTMGRSFGELDLCYQLRFEPQTVFHLFFGQRPLGSLPLWQVGNGQASISRPSNLLATSRRTCGTKPFLTLAA